MIHTIKKIINANLYVHTIKNEIVTKTNTTDSLQISLACDDFSEVA